MTNEPSWMETVRERDALFGLPPTTIEETETWASCAMACPDCNAIYHVPGFLESSIHKYAERDGWQYLNKRMICPKCVKARKE